MENTEHSLKELPFIPEEVQKIIDEEIQADIDPVLEYGDQETAEYVEQVMRELREHTYQVLAHVNKTINPQRVLYPASGFDKIPKLAFGEGKVIHTSLESKRSDKNYFDELGSGHKVIADNQTLPFRDETFDAICLLDSQRQIIGDDPEIYVKLLSPDGILILTQNNGLTPEDTRVEEYSHLSSLVPVPLTNLPLEGLFTEFFVLRKK